jgi:hypothetical protein
MERSRREVTVALISSLVGGGLSGYLLAYMPFGLMRFLLTAIIIFFMFSVVRYIDSLIIRYIDNH